MTRKNIILQQLNFLIAGIAIFLIGCTSFGKKIKSFFGGKVSSSTTKGISVKNYTKFSENPNIHNNVLRQYKRTTRQSLDKEAQLEEQAGSLWVKEGQGSYLFSQNTARMVGDSIRVKIEGESREQLRSKRNVIFKLLSDLESKLRSVMRAPAAGSVGPASQAKGSDDKKSDVLADPKDFPVKSISTRVTERLAGGNYRIRGGQSFMISSREYKVIVTGIVRAEDFSDDGISSTKLLDSKFDIVSVRKSL